MVKNENRNFSYMTRRIGGTTYKVKVVFNDTGHETMEDKILRIVRNEALDNDGKCDIMDVPQNYYRRSTDWRKPRCETVRKNVRQGHGD